MIYQRQMHTPYNILLWNLESAYVFYLKTDVCIKDMSGEFYNSLLVAIDHYGNQYRNFFVQRLGNIKYFGVYYE
jgi:hypothetical protein